MRKFGESYLFEEEQREGGRVQRIADMIADEMFAEFYDEHEAEKSAYRKHRASNKAEFRKVNHNRKYYRYHDCMHGWGYKCVQELNHAENRKSRHNYKMTGAEKAETLEEYIVHEEIDALIEALYDMKKNLFPHIEEDIFAYA